MVCLLQHISGSSDCVVLSSMQHALLFEHCYPCLLQNMFASSGGQLGKRLNKWVSSTLLYFLNIVYAAAALINFLGCLWYWVARREGVDNSWLISVGNDCPPLATSLPSRRPPSTM